MAGVWRYTLVVVVVLMCVCLWGSSEAVGGAKSRPRPQRRPPKEPKVDPIDVTPPAQNINMQQVRNEGKRLRLYTVYNEYTLTPAARLNLSAEVRARFYHLKFPIGS